MNGKENDFIPLSIIYFVEKTIRQSDIAVGVREKIVVQILFSFVFTYGEFFHEGFMQNNLIRLSQVFEQVPDPRGKQGREHPLSGLLAGQNYLAHIQYRAENHWKQLKRSLGFNAPKPPNRTTLSRILAKISLTELQEAFAVFLSGLLQDKALTAAVDGNILQMLNVFVHAIKITPQNHAARMVGILKTLENTVLIFGERVRE